MHTIIYIFYKSKGKNEFFETFYQRKHKKGNQNADRLHFESEVFAMLWNRMDDNKRLGVRYAWARHNFEGRVDAGARRGLSWTYVDTHDPRKDHYARNIDIFASSFVPKGRKNAWSSH